MGESLQCSPCGVCCSFCKSYLFRAGISNKMLNVSKLWSFLYRIECESKRKKQLDKSVMRQIINRCPLTSYCLTFDAPVVKETRCNHSVSNMWCFCAGRSWLVECPKAPAGAPRSGDISQPWDLERNQSDERKTFSWNLYAWTIIYASLIGHAAHEFVRNSLQVTASCGVTSLDHRWWRSYFTLRRDEHREDALIVLGGISAFGEAFCSSQALGEPLQLLIHHKMGSKYTDKIFNFGCM